MSITRKQQIAFHPDLVDEALEERLALSTVSFNPMTMTSAQQVAFANSQANRLTIPNVGPAIVGGNIGLGTARNINLTYTPATPGSNLGPGSAAGLFGRGGAAIGNSGLNNILNYINVLTPMSQGFTSGANVPVLGQLSQQPLFVGSRTFLGNNGLPTTFPTSPLLNQFNLPGVAAGLPSITGGFNGAGLNNLGLGSTFVGLNTSSLGGLNNLGFGSNLAGLNTGGTTFFR